MTLFQEKINYLFTTLNLDKKEFVKLFSNKKHRYSDRKKTIIDKWLKGKMKKYPNLEYQKYPISKKEIEGILIFPENCFKDEESLNIFKERVDNYNSNMIYINYKKFEFDYKYIYYFDRHKKEILEANFFITMEIKEEKEYKIKIIPNDFYFNSGKISEYTGILYIDEEGDFLISVRNNFETLRGYFLKPRGYNTNNKKLHGLMLGRSYNQGFPLCNKNILTNKKLNEKERTELYYILNESEDLISNENFEPFYKTHKEKYFNKFYEKIENLNSFMLNAQNLLKKEIKDDSYLNIFYDTFYSFYDIATNIKLNKRYWVSNKRRAYKKFLESLAMSTDTTCYIVNPIYDSFIYLFDEYSQNLVEHNIKLAQQGLKIEQIFVVSKEYKLNKFIQRMVYKLSSHNISVRFVCLHDIEQISSLDSYDFLCSNKEDIALYRATYAHKYLYNITPSKDKIWKLQSDYKKITKVSHSLKEFLIYQKEKDDDILQELTGVWYHYYYGSQKSSHHLQQIWSSKLKIDSNGEVKYLHEDEVILKGEINTTFNKEHPFIYITGIKSGSLALIQLDKHDIYREIFKAPILDKKLATSLNMISFGFFAKDKIDKTTVREILGEDNSILLEDNEMQNRIITYHNNKIFRKK